MDQGDEYQKTLQAAWRLLSYRPRAERELRERLLSKGFDECIVGKVIESLREAGEVDDSAFSRLWISSRESTKPMGRRRLQQELYAKGIPTEVINDELTSYSEAKEYALASQAAQGFWRKRCKNDDRCQATEKEIPRLAAWLQRRGFSSTAIAKVCRSYRTDCELDS